jgi:hypothetical protein
LLLIGFIATFSPRIKDYPTAGLCFVTPACRR